MTTAAVRARGLRPSWVAVALGLLVAAFVAGALIGPAHLAPGNILRSLVGVDSGLSEREASILWDLRMPRVVLGALVGATLALAGAAYQGVFRNPLADPYLLGVAAGAGLGATLAIAYLPGARTWPVDPVPLAAFIGALVAVAASYGLGRSRRGMRTATTLILAGVAMAAFLTALQTYVQQRESETLREVYVWILGRLSTAGWGEVVLILPYFAVMVAVVLLYRRLLDVLSVGDEEAETLGVRAGRVRLIVVVIASLGTAAAVAVSGLIAFVGIIVPHAVRLAFGASYRAVLPLSILAGATFMILADLGARTIASPAELPIGVVTALVGAPFFVVVLRTSARA